MMVRGRRKEEGVAKRNRERGRGGKGRRQTKRVEQYFIYIYLFTDLSTGLDTKVLLFTLIYF